MTVVVPVRDRPVQLERLLGALGQLACVVVDDASADAVAIREIAEDHGARFIGLTVNAGPSVARNAGLAAVGGALVAFVDSDCVPAAGWLDPLLGHFDDPRVGAVAPRVVPTSSGPRAGATVRYATLRSSLDRGPREGLVRPGSPVSFVPSAALLVRAGVAAGPELFDPALRGGEDVDLVWRLGEAGWDVRFVPASRVAHDGPPDFGSFLARQAFYGSTAGPLALRHGEALAPVHVSAWSLAVWVLTLARRPLFAQVALVTSVAILAYRLAGLVRDPVALAARIAGGGTARSALPALANLVRAWSPALVLGLASRRTRRAAALALLVPALHDWADNPSTLDPLRYSALHVADDAAYGVGVWAGCRAGAHDRAPRAPHLVAGACVVVPLPTAQLGRTGGRLSHSRSSLAIPWRSGADRPGAPSPSTPRRPRRARRPRRRSRACAAPRARPGGVPPGEGAVHPVRCGGAPGPPRGGRWSRASRPTLR